MLSTISRAALCGSALFCFSLPGCGGGSSTVVGKVVSSGKPVVWGSVTLVDTKGQFYQGPIGLDGTYRIENVPVGTVSIGVFSPAPPNDAPQNVPAPKGPNGMADPRAKFKQSQAPVPKPAQGAWFPLPEKASDPAASGLTGEIVSGTTTLDIDVR